MFNVATTLRLHYGRIIMINFITIELFSVSEMGENALLLVTLEDTLLRELSSSQGNILDNQELIATLENTKSMAVEIQGKLAQALTTKDDISSARSAYKPVAKRGEG